MEVALALVVVLVGGPLLGAIHMLLAKWMSARRARRIFEAQGVACLPRAFLSGNMKEFAAMQAKARAQPMPDLSHAIAPRILPHYFQWSKTYGEHFTFWFGFQPRYVLKHPAQAKEVLSTKSGHFLKFRTRPDFKEFIGDGLVTLNGEKWAQHRRILNPAFFVQKLKDMAPTMVMLTTDMMNRWKPIIDRKEHIDVAEEFRDLTGDIIAHTAFGSSFAEGKVVFELQHKQQELFSKLAATLYIPGSRFLPTNRNRYVKNIKNRIHGVLRQLIEKRLALGDLQPEAEYGMICLA